MRAISPIHTFLRLIVYLLFVASLSVRSLVCHIVGWKIGRTEACEPGELVVDRPFPRRDRVPSFQPSNLPTTHLLRPQSFDGIKLGSPHSRIDAEDQAGQQTETQSQGQGIGLDHHVKCQSRDAIEEGGHAISQTHPDQSSQETQDQRFDQELQ